MSKAIGPAFETKEEFKAWRRGHKELYHCLDQIIFAWRGSAAKAPGKPHGGVWAVYERAEWMNKTKLSLDQVKRYFAVLERAGLIDRERHRWAGRNNLTWVRPTLLALEFMSNRPQDKERLGRPEKAKTAPPLAPPSAPPLAPPSAPSDYTYFSSFPTIATDLGGCASSSPEEGKGKAGGEIKQTNIIKLKLPTKKAVPVTKPEPTPIVDEIEAMAKASKAKKLAKIKAKFPEIALPANSGVQHPADKMPDFAGWSEQVQTKVYAKYLGYAENVKAKGGKSLGLKHSGAIMSDEELAALAEEVAGMQYVDYEEALAQQSLLKAKS